MSEGVLSVVALERLQVQEHLLRDGQYHGWEGVAPSSRRRGIYIGLIAGPTTFMASKKRDTSRRPRVWGAGEVGGGSGGLHAL